MAIKVSISSVEALNRLIGGDTELEMEIKEQVVVEFTKRYLKSLVPGIIEKYQADFQVYARKVIEEHFFSTTKDGHWSTKLVPKEATEALKVDQVKYTFDKMIREVVDQKANEALTKVLTPEYIQSLMAANIQDAITQKARQIVQAKLSSF